MVQTLTDFIPVDKKPTTTTETTVVGNGVYKTRTEATGAAPVGLGGPRSAARRVCVDPPTDNSGDAAALVQAMAGCDAAAGAADGLNAAGFGADASQQHF